jgi:hypothetical protein
VCFAACVLGLSVGIASCGGANGSSGFDKDGSGGGPGGDGGKGADATMGSKDSGHFNLLGDATDTGTPSCTGIACNVQSCGGDPSQTTVTGYVYAPNGILPLYDVQVFVPNAPLTPFAQGVQCDNCGAPLSGEPIATALSDPTGHFVMTGVPSGTNIPIVVQLGKWRRQAYIPNVAPCTTTTLTQTGVNALTRLPSNQMDSDPPSTASMPHVALTTGGCDQMGCMLTKLGIADTEFGSQADGYTKAINVYYGSGGGQPAGATPAMNVWGSASILNTYDEVIFSCECSEALGSKGGVYTAAPFGVVTDYLNAGGRIFTTDFQYTWYKYSPDPNLGGGAPEPEDLTGIGSIYGGAPGGASPMTISTTLPKAVALSAWLKNIFSGVMLPSGATYPLDMYSQNNEINPDVVWGNIQWLDATKTVQWANSMYEFGGGGGPPADAGGLEPRIFTVDTPVGVASDKQCGRGVHLDAHIDQDGMNTVGAGYPETGCSATLKADEAAFAFFFFDLSSCISNEMEPPQPPPPIPK